MNLSKEISENIKTVEVAPEYIKKTLKFDDSDVLHINIKYPDVKILPAVLYQKPEKRINNFYDSVIKNFLSFCEKRLYKSAAAEFISYKNNPDSDIDFKPFGAVMTFEAAYNKQDFLRIYLDVSIYAGKNRENRAKKSHVWKISDGTLIPPKKFDKIINQPNN